MSLKNFRYTISSFFLVSFLFVKVVGAHGFIHFPDDTTTTEECTFCEDFLTQNTSPLINNTPADFEVATPVISREVNTVYHYNYYNNSIFYNFYNKPPPFSV